MAKSRGRRYYRVKKIRKTTNIYVIKAGPYYYVGKSNNPWRRLEAHKKKAKDGEGRNQRKNNIFRKYLHNLSLNIIEKPKMSNWREREIYHIARYRKKYGRDRVLNATDGGDGESGGNYRDDKDDKDNQISSPMFALIFVLFACGCLYYLN